MWDAELNPDETRVVPVGEDKDASNLAPFPGHATLVAEARKVVPRCLTQEQRAAAYLRPAPADWCVAMAKWPYHTKQWKALASAEAIGPQSIFEQDLAEERTTQRICRLVTAPVRRMRHSDRGRGPGYFRPTIGYLAGFLKIRRSLLNSVTLNVSKLLVTSAGTIRHICALMSRSNGEITGWEPYLLSDLPTGQDRIQSRAST